MNKILLKTGIRQTPYVKDDDSITKVYFDKSINEECKICYNYCPLSLDLKDEEDMKMCIKCLYCYLVCPNEIIKIEGDVGFLKPLIERYGLPIRGLE